MAKSKAELESDSVQYHELIDQARSALRDGHHEEAVQIAWASCKHIDGMMQFERKYESREFSSVEAIDVLLEYAPLLFHFQVLDDLESLLKSQRRIDRDASDDLADDLSKARTRMWEAHRLWNYIEQSGRCRQDELRANLGGNQDQWRSIAESWEKIGLIRRTSDRGSYRLSLTTRIDAETAAKCPACGTVINEVMYKLLEKSTCPKCQTKGSFVFLSRVPSATK